MVSGIPSAAIRRGAVASWLGWITHPPSSSSRRSKLIVAGRRIESGDITIMMVGPRRFRAHGGSTKRRAEGHRRGDRRGNRRGEDRDRARHRPPRRSSWPRWSAMRRNRSSRSPTRCTPTTTTTSSEAVAGEAQHRRSDGDRRQERPQHRLDQIEGRALAALCGRREIPGSVPARTPVRPSGRSAHCQKKVVRSRIVNEGATHRRPRHRRPTAFVGRRRSHPHVTRLGVVPAWRDPGADRPHPPGMPRMEAVDRPRRVQYHEALHPPLQLRPVLHRRDRTVGAPRRREIGHARSPSGHLLPVVRRRRSGPTPCAVVSEECSAPTDRPRWLLCAARRSH